MECKLIIYINFLQNKTNLNYKRPLEKVKSAQPSKKAKIDKVKTIDFTSNIVKTKRYGDFEFLEDDKGYVHVYTDGSCENNGRSNAIAGYGVYFSEGHPLYVIRFPDQKLRFYIYLI